MNNNWPYNESPVQNRSGIFNYSAGPIQTYEWPTELFAQRHAEFLQPEPGQFSGYWDNNENFHIVKDRRYETA
jgi:hypothetical protein